MTMHKVVNGEQIPLNAEEEQEFQNMAAEWAAGVIPRRITEYTGNIRSHMDVVAKNRGYTDRLSIVTYLDSQNELWKAEALAFRDWRDQVWEYGLTEFDKMAAETRSLPSNADFIAELPTISWPA